MKQDTLCCVEEALAQLGTQNLCRKRSETIPRPGSHGLRLDLPLLPWLSRNRRLSKDYERKVQTSETLIQVAMIRLLLARVGCKS